MKYIKKHLYSGLIFLVPMLYGVLIYSKLPALIALGVDKHKEFTSFVSKDVFVFIIPISLYLIHVVISSWFDRMGNNKWYYLLYFIIVFFIISSIYLAYVDSLNYGPEYDAIDYYRFDFTHPFSICKMLLLFVGMALFFVGAYIDREPNIKWISVAFLLSMISMYMLD